MKGVSLAWVMMAAAIASSCQSSIDLTSVWDNRPILPTSHHSQMARVTRVVSGHTIEVQPTLHATTLNQTVRLIGIQAPDQGQSPWGPEAQAYLESLLLGETVQLSWADELDDGEAQQRLAAEGVDSYGRQWAYVWLNGQLVNQQLISDGVVLAEERSPHLQYVQHFNHAQHRARILGLGVWHPDHPMRQTPREFRQQQDRL